MSMYDHVGVRTPISKYDSRCDVKMVGPFDPAARPLALAVSVRHQREQHRRFLRRPPPAVEKVIIEMETS